MKSTIIILLIIGSLMVLSVVGAVVLYSNGYVTGINAIFMFGGLITLEVLFGSCFIATGIAKLIEPNRENQENRENIHLLSPPLA